MFVMRDPRGIRPCHMLVTEDVIAFASERVPLMTVFEADASQVKAVDPGCIVTIKADGTYDQIFAKYFGQAPAKAAEAAAPAASK